MSTWTAFDSHLTDLYDTFWDVAGSPKPTQFRAILCNNSTWTQSSNATTVTNTQLATGNGYTSGGVALSGHTSTYDNGQNRTEGRPASVSWTATGGNITFDAIVVTATINSATRLCLYRKYTSAQTIADGETRTFTIELNLGRAGADVEAA